MPEATDYVLAYDMEEGSGTVLNNTGSFNSGSGEGNLDFTNTPTWVAGPGPAAPLNEAVQFDESDNSYAIETTNHGNPFGASQECTYAIMMTLPAVTGNDEAWPFILGNDSSNAVSINLFQGTLFAGWSNGGTYYETEIDYDATGLNVAGDGLFHKYVFTVERTNAGADAVVTLYVDDVQEAQTTHVGAPNFANNGYLAIYNRPFSGVANSLDSKVASIRVYNYAMTSAEAADIFSGSATEVTKTFSLDAVIQAADNEETFNLDAILKGSPERTFSLDAIVARIGIHTFDLDAVLIQGGTKLFDLDAIIKQLDVARTFNLDANVVNLQIRPFSLDAVLAQTVETTFSLDALLERNRKFSLDAVLEYAPDIDLFFDSPILSWELSGLSTPGRVMKLLRISSLSKEYVKVPVKAFSAGEPVDITEYDIEMAFTSVDADDIEPIEADWTTGSWEEWPNNIYLARALIGPGSDKSLTDGTYHVWVRIPTNQETVVRRVGKVVVT